MILTVPICREHYEQLFDLVEQAEPFRGFSYYDQFCQQMDSREGFSYWEDGKIIGCISFSDYVPDHCVVIHAAFHPEHRGKMNRGIIRHVFNYLFEELAVPRVISFSIVGLTDQAGEILRKLGFRKEGLLIEAGRLPDGNYDVQQWAMLKRECKWL